MIRILDKIPLESASVYITEWADDERATITLRQLLDMRSGMPTACFDQTTGSLGVCATAEGADQQPDRLGEKPADEHETKRTRRYAVHRHDGLHRENSPARGNRRGVQRPDSHHGAASSPEHGAVRFRGVGEENTHGRGVSGFYESVRFSKVLRISPHHRSLINVHTVILFLR